MSLMMKLRDSLLEGAFESGYSEQYGGYKPSFAQ